MINELKTEMRGSKIQMPVGQFGKLITNYKLLKATNEKLVEANKYLNEEIRKYNKDFTNG